MSRRAAFREADLTRAIRAALKAGLKVGEFEVKSDCGEVTILTHPAGAVPSSPDQEDSAWAAGMAKWRRTA